MCFETGQPYRVTPTFVGAEREEDIAITLSFGSGPNWKFCSQQQAKISPSVFTEKTAGQTVHWKKWTSSNKSSDPRFRDFFGILYVTTHRWILFVEGEGDAFKVFAAIRKNNYSHPIL